MFQKSEDQVILTQNDFNVRYLIIQYRVIYKRNRRESFYDPINIPNVSTKKKPK